jgi:hypothetical protein
VRSVSELPSSRPSQPQGGRGVQDCLATPSPAMPTGAQTAAWPTVPHATERINGLGRHFRTRVTFAGTAMRGHPCESERARMTTPVGATFVVAVCATGR